MSPLQKQLMNAMSPDSVAAHKWMASEKRRIRSTGRHRRMPRLDAVRWVSRRQVMKIVGPVTRLQERTVDRPVPVYVECAYPAHVAPLAIQLERIAE
jgi:hypothetical protein